MGDTLAHRKGQDHRVRRLGRKPVAVSGATRHPGRMPLVRVHGDAADEVAALAEIHEASRVVDDPDAYPLVPELLAGQIRYGWDLYPGEHYLYTPEGGVRPVALLQLDLPKRDNTHLVWGAIVVHPEHRRQGHGSALLAELLRVAQEAGRTTVWLEAAEDDAGARAFVEGAGFHYASHDARRRQVLAEVNASEIDRLAVLAEAASGDYRVERRLSPVPDELLAELVEVTAAINDAPMGDLTYEDEQFDVARLQDFETARVGRGDLVYRVIARREPGGEVGGHTVMVTNPLRAEVAWQADTAVARAHRGHRLGLRLKIEMLRWLAEADPQVKAVETWNNADNDFMVSVNEALGYRLSRIYATFERTL